MNIQAYTKPQTIEEAYQILHQQDNNEILGGGAWLKLTNKTIGTLIDISSLPIHGITESKETITIGAQTTLHELEVSTILQDYAHGILANAAKSIMGMNVRNIATIGGSIMGKYSFSDLITPLLALGVTLQFHHHGSMSLAEFLTTKHMEKDILTAIECPKSVKHAYFYNVKRTAMDFAVLNVAIIKNDRVHIVVGARPGGSVFATKAMNYINQQTTISEDIIDQTAMLAQEEIHVSENFRAQKEYRELLVKVYVKRGLKEVCTK